MPSTRRARASYGEQPVIDIAFPLDESHREQAGLIYYEAFRRKLQPLTGKPAQTRALLTAGLNLDRVMGALEEGKLLGIAGLHSHEGTFVRITLRKSMAALGVARGFGAWVGLNLLAAGLSCPTGVLRIAALAVDPIARGRGVGSRLLEAVSDKARCEGFHTVRLEVVDTNTGARQLYERMGFTVVTTHHYPLIRNWLGFSGEHVMVKPP